MWAYAGSPRSKVYFASHFTTSTPLTTNQIAVMAIARIKGSCLA